MDGWGDGKVVGPGLALICLCNFADVAANDELANHGSSATELGVVRGEEAWAGISVENLLANGSSGVGEVVVDVSLDVCAANEGRVGEKEAFIVGVSNNYRHILPVTAVMELGEWKVLNEIVINAWAKAEGAIGRSLDNSVVCLGKFFNGGSTKTGEPLASAARTSLKGLVLSLETIAIIQWLKCRRLNDSSVEEGVLLSTIGYEVMLN